jgi:hypothetical protein
MTEVSDKHETSFVEDPEKGHIDHIHRTESDIEKDNGALQLFADGHTHGLKLAKDGKVRFLGSSRSVLKLMEIRAQQTILIPQPSDDPADPMNWPGKHSIFSSLRRS